MSSFSFKDTSSSFHFTREKFLFYILFPLIFSFSFYLYSPYTSIRFSSDHAVHVLMTHDFKFPDNLYFWGQNRLGSFVPMVAHLLCFIPGISPFFAVTLVHWGILFITALIICRFFSATFTKVLFLVFWLIPLYPFKEHLSLSHPYAPQFFFIISGLFFLEKFQSSSSGNYFFLVTGMLFLLLSCWISELSAVFLALFFVLKLGWLLKYSDHKLILASKKAAFTVFFITVVVITCTAWFIVYAKSHAANITEYSSIFSHPKEWLAGIKKHLQDILNIFSQPLQYPFKWLYSVLFLLAIILTIIFSWKRRHSIPNNKLFYLRLFSISAALIWFGLYMLSWTHVNEFDYRHWTFAYLFVILAILLAADNVPGAFKPHKIALAILALTQISISYAYATDKSSMRNDIDFSYSEFKNFRQLGNCGVIGNYWFTYLVAAADPLSIVATPRETEYARDPNLIPLVFQKPKIYLAKNRWFNNWPPFAGQYGHLMQKSGAPFTIEWVEFCEYKLIDGSFSVKAPDLMHDSLSTDKTDGIHVNPGNQGTNAFAVFGPFMELPAGKYRGCFYLDSLVLTEKDTVVVDIVSNYGGIVFFNDTLKRPEQKPATLSLPFEFTLPAYTPNLETRIFIKGKASFILNKIDFVKR